MPASNSDARKRNAARFGDPDIPLSASDHEDAYWRAFGRADRLKMRLDALRRTVNDIADQMSENPANADVVGALRRAIEESKAADL